jgi:predicted metal-dependent hydrolase
MSSKPVAAEIYTSTQEQGVFAYGDDVIHYDVIRRTQHQSENTSAKARKVLIKVHPDQRVVATVPFDATQQAIQQAMTKRARWVWQNMQDFAKQKEYVLPKQYISGDTQFYLGKRYVLKVTHDTSQPSCVKLRRGKLNVSLITEKDNQKRYVKALLDSWYHTRAKIVFYDRLQAMLPKATWEKGIPSFRIMEMKKQWGSCSSQGSLMLNPHLVKAPKECIDYVILHELCHIAEHNHSEKFWRLLTQVMPNWKEVKARLDDMAELYLNE